MVLYLYVSTDFFLHEWDERYHALVAKNLLKHPFIPTLYDHPILPYDYKNWVGNHIWVHKQPVPLWTMAASMYVFGINELALRLPSILMSSLGIWLTYKIGKYFYNSKTGVLAAFLFSVNGLIIELTGGRVATDHFDIFFLFFILLAIFFTIKYVQQKKTYYTIIVGVCVGVAILTKWFTALIILPIWILIITQERNFNLRNTIVQFSLLLITISAVFLPWQIYIFHEFPQEAAWEAEFNFRHFTEVIEGRSGPFYYFLNKIRINYGELIYLPVGWFIWKTWKEYKNKKRFALFIWFLVPLVVFSFAKTKMQGYLLFTAPVYFLMTAEFFFALQRKIKDLRIKWPATLILALLIILPVRYGIERIKPFEIRDRNPSWVQSLKSLNKEPISKGVLLNYENPIEAMFYTKLTAYAKLPDEEKIRELIEQGYTVIINDNDHIPDHLANMDGVTIKKLIPADSK
ncbi:MAG: glycosyltransferase family 39 protein [Bacteroidota bacterium]